MGVGARRVLLVVEGVGRRADTEERLAALHVVHDVPHVSVRQTTEAQEQHDHVSLGEHVQPRNVPTLVGVDLPGLGVLTEEHRAAEAMVHSEDLAQLREGFLGPILLVSGDEHDVLRRGILAHAGPLSALVGHPAGVLVRGLGARLSEILLGEDDPRCTQEDEEQTGRAGPSGKLEHASQDTARTRGWARPMADPNSTGDLAELDLQRVREIRAGPDGTGLTEPVLEVPGLSSRDRD